METFVANQLSVGKKIRAIRLAMGLIQKDFAKKVGLPQPNLSDYENDKVLPNDRTIKDILNIARVNPDWWKSGEGEMFHKHETNYIHQSGDQNQALNKSAIVMEAQAEYSRLRALEEENKRLKDELLEAYKKLLKKK